MNEVTIDVNEGRKVGPFLVDNVAVPNLVEKCVHPLNLFMQSMNASTDAVTMSVSAPKP